ncbi:hypothetical protein EDL98_06785 [Ornithobacterium rhinotracheale]|nr:hypothetical protein [Ornithobacterium rhinotracheale]
MYMIYAYGLSVFNDVFWIKIISFVLIFLYHRQYKSRYMYYYFNLGVSESFIWIFIALFEFVIFISLTTIINYY